jgi:hypothetical protein
VAALFWYRWNRKSAQARQVPALAARPIEQGAR